MNTSEHQDNGIYQVSLEVTDEGKLDLPQHFVTQLRPGYVVHITVVPNEQGKDVESREWADLTAQQFLAGYSDADAIYDKLYG